MPSEHSTIAPIATPLYHPPPAGDNHASNRIPNIALTPFLTKNKFYPPPFPHHHLACTSQIAVAHPLHIWYFSPTLPFLLLSHSYNPLYRCYPHPHSCGTPSPHQSTATPRPPPTHQPISQTCNTHLHFNPVPWYPPHTPYYSPTQCSLHILVLPSPTVFCAPLSPLPSYPHQRCTSHPLVLTPALLVLHPIPLVLNSTPPPPLGTPLVPLPGTAAPALLLRALYPFQVFSALSDTVTTPLLHCNPHSHPRHPYPNPALCLTTTPHPRTIPMPHSHQAQPTPPTISITLLLLLFELVLYTLPPLMFDPPPPHPATAPPLSTTTP